MRPYDVMISGLMEKFLRVLNKYSAIEKIPMDFGIGERLYPSEIHTIESIGKNQEINVTGLADVMGITKGAVSQMIGKLIQKGLVIKSKDPFNDKEVRLGLTPRGWSAFAGHEKFHSSIYEDIINNFSNISSEHIDLFQGVLNKIETHMDDYMKLAK